MLDIVDIDIKIKKTAKLIGINIENDEVFASFKKHITKQLQTLENIETSLFISNYEIIKNNKIFYTPLDLIDYPILFLRADENIKHDNVLLIKHNLNLIKILK